MSVLRQSRRGDMYVQANVEIPVNLNSKQKDILRGLKMKEVLPKNTAQNPKAFSQIKEVWEDLT